MKVKHVEPWMREWAFEASVEVLTRTSDAKTRPEEILTHKMWILASDWYAMPRYQQEAMNRAMDRHMRKACKSNTS